MDEWRQPLPKMLRLRPQNDSFRPHNGKMKRPCCKEWDILETLTSVIPRKSEHLSVYPVY